MVEEVGTDRGRKKDQCGGKGGGDGREKERKL